MVICRITIPHQLQGGACMAACYQSRCGLHLKSLSCVRAYSRCEPPQPRAALCVPEPEVWVHAPRRSDWRKKRDVEDAPGPAGLDQDGMFVTHPRCLGP